MTDTTDHPPIGIDLGTTNSLIAVLRDGRPELIPNALGQVLTPSVVSVDGDRILVGEAARDRLATHPRDTAATFKRAMGTASEFRLGKRSFRAEDLSSLVLRRLKEDAEAHLGQLIRDVVVSVPAYFNQPQRKATLAACALAGLNAVRLVNEPTAAALAYGLQDREGESQFLVFDLGGGTFDATVLDHFDGVMQVKASSGDAFLGGEDFTEALAHAIADRLDRPWARLGEALQRQIRLQADLVKRRLSGAEAETARITLDGTSRDIAVTREMFETAAAPLMKRLFRPIERCFYDSRIDIDALDQVVLVGGATRMPMIRHLVARQFRRLPEMGIDPDHAVALGAAVQAGLVAMDAGLDDVVMTDVSPFSVGIATGTKLGDGRVIAGFFEPIIERNTALPASREKVFSTIADNQTQLRVEIFQGEAPRVEDNVALGTFDVTLPRAPAGREAMAVRITYDTSGLIEVEGRSLSTGQKAGTVIRQNADGLSDAAIAERLGAMAALKLDPREDAENVALLARLRRVYEMLSGHDRSAVQAMLMRFEAVILDQDRVQIARVRGEIGQSLDRIDDYYAT